MSTATATKRAKHSTAPVGESSPVPTSAPIPAKRQVVMYNVVSRFVSGVSAAEEDIAPTALVILALRQKGLVRNRGEAAAYLDGLRQERDADAEPVTESRIRWAYTLSGRFKSLSSSTRSFNRTLTKDEEAALADVIAAKRENSRKTAERAASKRAARPATESAPAEPESGPAEPADAAEPAPVRVDYVAVLQDLARNYRAILNGMSRDERSALVDALGALNDAHAAYLKAKRAK